MDKLNAMSNFHETFKIKFTDLNYIYLDTHGDTRGRCSLLS